MAPDLLGRLLDQMSRLQQRVLAPKGISPNGFTYREIEVLRLLADGYDTAAIAETLAYSERTIKNVIHDVTSRLHLRNRSHAVFPVSLLAPARPSSKASVLWGRAFQATSARAPPRPMADPARCLRRRAIMLPLALPPRRSSWRKKSSSPLF
jgi:DNA-binding CsgD family transcriptional regulator